MLVNKYKIFNDINKYTEPYYSKIELKKIGNKKDIKLFDLKEKLFIDITSELIIKNNNSEIVFYNDALSDNYSINLLSIYFRYVKTSGTLYITQKAVKCFEGVFNMNPKEIMDFIRILSNNEVITNISQY